MEFKIEILIKVAVLGLACQIHLIQQEFKLPAMVVGNMLGSALCGKAEDERTQILNLKHFPDRNLAYEHAAIHYRGHQADTRKNADRFTDRTPAGTHTQCQRC